MQEALLREMNLDVRAEVRIGMFWRQLIGDDAYLRFDPIDMLRWYLALELRGPDEVRDYLQERQSSRSLTALNGIVTRAPHPPVWLVEAWLEHYETKTDLGWIWKSAAVFLLGTWMLASSAGHWPYLWRTKPPYPPPAGMETQGAPTMSPGLAAMSPAPSVPTPSLVVRNGRYTYSSGAGTGGVAATGLQSGGGAGTPAGATTGGGSPSH